MSLPRLIPAVGRTVRDTPGASAGSSAAPRVGYPWHGPLARAAEERGHVEDASTRASRCDRSEPCGVVT